MQDQAFLGPESGLAVPDEDGGVDLYIATQWLHVDRDQLAASLGLPPEKVRLTLAGVGGAFGGREDLSMQVHACLLALHTGRPVKIVYGREESFFGHVHRHPARMRYEHGATHDGELVYVRARILLDGGAYASSLDRRRLERRLLRRRPVRRAQRAHRRLRRLHRTTRRAARCAASARCRSASRHEAQMDKLAAALGMDPVELRIRNAMRTGSLDADRPGRPGARRRSPSCSSACGRCRCPPTRRGRTRTRARSARAPRRRLEHDPRRGRAARRRLRRRLQERRLLRGLRRLLDRARAPVAWTAASRSSRSTPRPPRSGRALVTVQAQIARTELGVERVVVLPADTRVGRPGRAPPRARPTSPAAR